MADLKFTCSHCGQEIECDELWSGHEIQCPTCQGQLVVPPKPDAPPHAALASAKPGQPRLSIGQSRAQRSAAPPPPPPQASELQQQLNQAKARKEGQRQKWVAIGAVVVILGVGGYFGYGYFSEWQAKRSEAAKQAEQHCHPTGCQRHGCRSRSAAPAPEKELPVSPPSGRSIVDKATIPEGKVNGIISGTNFVAETAVWTGRPHLPAELFQGASPRRTGRSRVYLHLNPGQSPTGHTWTVSQDMRDRSVPQVVKRWKTNPRYAPQSKALLLGLRDEARTGRDHQRRAPRQDLCRCCRTPSRALSRACSKPPPAWPTRAGAAAVSPVVAPNPVAAPTAPNAGGTVQPLPTGATAQQTLAGPPAGRWPHGKQIQFPRQGAAPHRAAGRGRAANGRAAPGARTDFPRNALQHHRRRRPGRG